MPHVWGVLRLISVLAAAAAEASRCVRFSQSSLSPICRDAVDYSAAWIPNGMGQSQFDEIGLEIYQFFPLVKVQCSASLKPFLCVSYHPPCRLEDTKVIQSCRELCEAARDGCEPLMKRFGFSWPEKLACDRLPAIADGQTCHNSTSGEPITPARHTEEAEESSQTPVTGANTTDAHSAPEQDEDDSSAPPTLESAGCPSGIPGMSEVTSALVRYLAGAERLQRVQEDTLKLEQDHLRLQIRMLRGQLGVH